VRACCPGSCGCNDPDGGGLCALEILRATEDEPEVDLALERWKAFESALQKHCRPSELRFRRRAYLRARDRALIVLAMRDLSVANNAQAPAAAAAHRLSVAPPVQPAQDADRRGGIAA
jgi:hypothetical protein